jgi:hypothetical protein
MSTPDFKDAPPPEPVRKSAGDTAKSGIGKILGWIGGLLLAIAAYAAVSAITAPSWSYAVPGYWAAAGGFGIVGVILLLVKYKLEY